MKIIFNSFAKYNISINQSMLSIITRLENDKIMNEVNFSWENTDKSKLLYKLIIIGENISIIIIMVNGLYHIFFILSINSTSSMMGILLNIPILKKYFFVVKKVWSPYGILVILDLKEELNSIILKTILLESIPRSNAPAEIFLSSRIFSILIKAFSGSHVSQCRKIKISPWILIYKNQ